jgi:hypothetical protein
MHHRWLGWDDASALRFLAPMASATYRPMP